LAAAAPHFPEGTIHVVVVDPGVGGKRRALALRTKRAIFVGPDNGVLSWAVRQEVVEEIRCLTNRAWHLAQVSQTFHGRDIFAPVAARLACGAAFEEAGELIDDFVRLTWPALMREKNRIAGEVIHVDRFGNAITNIPCAELRNPGAFPNRAVVVRCGGNETRIHLCYADVSPGEALALFGSSGLLELAVNGGDFADHFGVEEGSRAEASW